MDLKFLRSGMRTLKPGLQHYAGALRKKGGMVNMPKKKSSKSYSRSLLATNQLFAQNPLLKKPKSKKRKIFDPNSKYYQDGGLKASLYASPDLESTVAPSINYSKGNFDVSASSDVPIDALSRYRKNLMLNTNYNQSLGRFGNLNLKGNVAYNQDYGTNYSLGLGYNVPISKNLGFNVQATLPSLANLKNNYGAQAGLTYTFEKGGFQDDINRRRNLLRDWTYGASIGMLHKAQQGGPKPEPIKPDKTKQQIYHYSGRPNAVYTKDANNKWLIKAPDTNMKWQYIDDPKGERSKLLNKQAFPIDNSQLSVINERQMEAMNKKREDNIVKNLENELKVYDNKQKYLPHYRVEVGESTTVDSPIKKQFNKSKHQAEEMRIMEIRDALKNQKIKEAIKAEEDYWKNSPEGKKAEWERRSSGRAQPSDWFWTLPLAGSAAGRSSIIAAGELFDIPATIGGTEYSALTAGNVLRGYYTSRYLKELPDALRGLNRAKTTDQKIAAVRKFVNTAIGASPAFKWNNILYRNLATPLSFAENTRKYFSNEELDPTGATANTLRTMSSLLKREEGGDVWEDEIDDETRAKLEAQGYIVEDLD